MGLKAAGLRKVWVGIVVFIALFCTACGEGSLEREIGVEGYFFKPKLLMKGQDLGGFKLKSCEGFLYYLKDNFWNIFLRMTL